MLGRRALLQLIGLGAASGAVASPPPHPFSAEAPMHPVATAGYDIVGAMKSPQTLMQEAKRAAWDALLDNPNSRPPPEFVAYQRAHRRTYQDGNGVYHDGTLDPDLKAYKSFSHAAKAIYQRERDIERTWEFYRLRRKAHSLQEKIAERFGIHL